MLKQPCHTLSTAGACGTSYSNTQGISQKITLKNKEVSTLVGRLLAWTVSVLNVWEERRSLEGLTTDQLKDIGVTERQAKQESHRAYWDLPTERNF